MKICKKCGCDDIYKKIEVTLCVDVNVLLSSKRDVDDKSVREAIELSNLNDAIEDLLDGAFSVEEYTVVDEGCIWCDDNICR